jgi:hypothetical protein
VAGGGGSESRGEEACTRSKWGRGSAAAKCRTWISPAAHMGRQSPVVTGSAASTAWWHGHQQNGGREWVSDRGDWLNRTGPLTCGP